MTGFQYILFYYNRVYDNSNNEYFYRIAPQYISTVIKWNLYK